MINGCGVIVRRDGKYLIGKRADGKGWCSGGGHIERGETPRQAARRELYEEFGIVALIFEPLGVIEGKDYVSHIFLVDNPVGEPRADKDEILKCTWAERDGLRHYVLFEPFQRSLKLLDKAQDGLETIDGGPGSGRYPKGSGGDNGVMGKEFTGVKGQAAVEKLLAEKQGHVKGAFSRADIGDIDLIWGNDNMGLQHIIKRRGEQGVNPNKILSHLSDVVENGTLKASKRANEKPKFVIEHKGDRAIIGTSILGNASHFVLSAYEI
jgi:8-oxo-dGTP pyrophosphatase MutT (NUDIX family)